MYCNKNESIGYLQNKQFDQGIFHSHFSFEKVLLFLVLIVY